MSPLINFSGIASGIDSSALIGAILDQRRNTQIKPIQSRIDNLTATNKSLDKLSELLDSLKSAASQFRSLGGGAIAKLGVSTNETVATGSATNAAQTGTYSLSVSQLARGSTYSFSDRFTTSSDVINSGINNGALDADRTVTVTTGTGSNEESVDIVLTNTTTIGDFVSQYNAASSNSEASLVNVGTTLSPSYALVIRSKDTGLEKGQVSVGVGTEIQTAGSGAFNTATASTTQALNAQFTLTGISGTIERGSNTVSDVVDGLSINLLSVGSATLSVSNDPQSTKTSLRKFVDAYNEVVKFISEEDSITPTVEDGEVKNVFGSLSETEVDNAALSQLRQSLLSSGTSGRAVNSLADFGITTARDGTLSFNEEDFEDAIASDPEGIRIVSENLGEDLASVDGLIAQFTRYNGLIDTTLNLNKTSISNSQSRISELEASLGKQESSLVAQFARLESVIGKLTQQQSALSGLLPG